MNRTKLFIILLISFLVSNSLVAQSIEKQHKALMVQYINSEEFDKAYNEFNKFELTFDSDQSDANLNYPKFRKFIDYTKKHGLTTKQFSCISLYFGNSLFSGAHILEERNDLQNAIVYYEEAIKYFEKVTKNANSYYKQAVSNLAYSHFNKAIIAFNNNDYTKSEVELYAAIPYIEKSNDTELNCLTNLYLANIYDRLNQKNQSEKKYEETITLSAKLYGKESEKYIIPACSLARVYMENNKIQESLSLYISIARILERKNDLVNLVEVYDQIANCYYLMPDFDKSLVYHQKALLASEKHYGKENQKYIDELYYYTNQAVNFKPEAETLSLIQEGLQLTEKLYSRNSQQYVTFLSVYGRFLRSIGDTNEQRAVYESILSYSNNLQFSDSIKMSAYDDLGRLYNDVNDFVNAERCLLEAIKYAKAARINPFAYADLLYNLGTAYAHNGMYKQAENMLFEAYYINQENVYPYSITGHSGTYGYLLNSIAELMFQELCIDKSTIEKALYYADLALDEISKQQGTNNLGYANALGTKALILSITDAKAAESLYLQELSICKDILGENSEMCADIYNSLAILYSTTDLEKSKLYYEKTIEIDNKRGADPGIAYSNLAMTNYQMNDFSSASRNFEKYLSSVQKIIANTFGALTEQQCQQYWSKYEFLQDYLMSTVGKAEGEKIAAASMGYDCVLLNKGILLNAYEKRKNVILKSGDTALINLWNQLTSYRKQIISIQESDKIDQNALNYIENKCQELDKKISMYKFIPKETITWKDIKSGLMKNEVAVEIVRYWNYNEKLKHDSVYYAALVISPKMDIPVWVNLFEESEIDTLLKSSPNDIYISALLYKLFWSKLQPYIQNGNKVFFAPDGVLYQTNIELAENDEGKRINEVYQLERVSSTREVLNQDDKQYDKSAVLYGGLIYNRSIKAMSAESSKYGKQSNEKFRDFDIDTVQRAGVDYLEGSLNEVVQIASILSKDDYTVVLDSAGTGTEESFKTLDGNNIKILHIATHGFFFKQDEAERKDVFYQQVSRAQSQQINCGIDPMLRSGLLFSGANRAYTGHRDQLPEGVQDGILTAKEISLLDLTNVDLVVLSACHTAKGDITSEGVFGLQRAFKMAGVQTIIMSLWSVSDQATQLLMTEFYRNWIEKKQPKREAFKNAQNAVRYATDDEGKRKFEKPVYWAGFMMLD